MTSAVIDSLLWERERPVTAFRVRRRVDAGVLAAVSLAFYLFSSLSNYALYLSHGFDLGIFDQAVRGYAHFRLPLVPIKGPHFIQLGDHFSPVLALFAPLYWIWDDPRMLLIGQAVLVAVSVVVVHRIASRRVGRGAAVLLAAVFAFGWPIQSLVNFDVHEVAFALPLLALAFDAMERQRWRTAAIWALSLVLVKEDLTLVVAVFGLVLWLRARRSNRREARRLGAMLAVAGLASFVVLTQFVIPAIAGTDGYIYWQYHTLGSGPGQALIGLFTHPWTALTTFFTPAIKSVTIAMLILPLAGLCLRSTYSLLAIPLLAELMLGDVKTHWLPVFQYDALPWLALCIGAVDVLTRFTWTASLSRRLSIYAMVTLMAAAQWICVQGISVMTKPDSGRSLLNRIPDRDPQIAADRKAALRTIPSNVCVEASDFLIPYLVSRDYVSVLLAQDVYPDYAVVDLTHPDVPGDTQGAPESEAPSAREAADAFRRAGYVTIGGYGHVTILRAPTSFAPSRACAPLGQGKRALPSEAEWPAS